MKLNDFFATHPVFTTNELKKFLAARGSHNSWTRKALLAYHLKQGRVRRVRRGLYCTVPPGASPVDCPVDAFVLAAKSTDDAVLAYHTALELHGRAYSVHHRLLYLTAKRLPPWSFRSLRFRSVLFPKVLRDKNQEEFGVDVVWRENVDIRVTSLERTLVDVLDRLDLGGGLTEAWQSLESVEFFDLEKVVEYTLLLENGTTAARVGFFLDQHRETLMVEDHHLVPLREHLPKTPHYLLRDHRGTARLVDEWNLLVPLQVLDRSWEEQR
ncbi:MAG: type IV toxin-antitoxin system AbiEi family antitoxin domain-containing protein [Candidatus Eisenbacteria sp.]|nr:type IV toxin-antitoxin system AbiEi family antitoxin domain-containing protein [Candidatus Eisenbacteria bacterium]